MGAKSNIYNGGVRMVEVINSNDDLKIYDKEMNTVGELYFDNGKVIINAKYNKSYNILLLL